MPQIIRQRGTGPRATSCRNTGRHHLGMPGRLHRNPHVGRTHALPDGWFPRGGPSTCFSELRWTVYFACVVQTPRVGCLTNLPRLAPATGSTSTMRTFGWEDPELA